MVDFFCVRHVSRAVRPSVNEIGADGGAWNGRANVLS